MNPEFLNQRIADASQKVSVSAAMKAVNLLLSIEARRYERFQERATWPRLLDHCWACLQVPSLVVKSLSSSLKRQFLKVTSAVRRLGLRKTSVDQ